MTITYHENVQDTEPTGTVFVPKEILSHEIIELLAKHNPGYVGNVAIKRHNGDTIIYLQTDHPTDGVVYDRIDIQSI